MKRKRFTEEQIIGILKEAEAGAKSTDLCRRHAISEQTFYRWKAKYAGLEPYVPSLYFKVWIQKAALMRVGGRR